MQSTNWDKEQEAVASRTAMEFESAVQNSPRSGGGLGESTPVLRRRGEGQSRESAEVVMVEQSQDALLRFMGSMCERMNKMSEDSSGRYQRVMEEMSETLKETVRGMKRTNDVAEEKIKGETPKLFDFKELTVGGGEDNAHDVLCWAVRKRWRMVNRDPASYWKEGTWPMKVEPDLAGQVHMDHLVPLMFSDRTLSWSHNAGNKMELRHFIHNNSKAKRVKGQKVEVRAHEGEGLGGMAIEAYTNWNEAGSVKEMMEGVMNMLAVWHMVRPWDFGGLVILRVLHECAYFGPAARSIKEQKELLKEFVDDVLQKNGRRAVAGQHPLPYREALKRAGDIVASTNGMSYNLLVKTDPYVGYREVKMKDERIKKLGDENIRLKKELAEERRKKGRDHGYKEGERRYNGRPVGKGGDTKNLPQEFWDERRTTCRWFNEGDCRRSAADCTRGAHKCSAPVGNKMCGEDHSRKEHK